MGRNKIGTAVLIRIPDDLLDAIDQRAAAMGVQRPEIIRRMLRWANQQPSAAEKGRK